MKKLTAFLEDLENNYQFANNIVHSDSFMSAKVYDKENNNYFTVKELNTVLINFVLDIVGEEVENLIYDCNYDIQHCKESNIEYFYGNKKGLEDIKQILTNLKKNV